MLRYMENRYHLNKITELKHWYVCGKNYEHNIKTRNIIGSPEKIVLLLFVHKIKQG